MVSGAVLNDLLKEHNCLQEAFDNDVDYKVCASMKRRAKIHEVAFIRRKRALEALTRASKKATRRSKRRNPSRMIHEGYFKTVRVRYNNTEEDVHYFGDNEDNSIIENNNDTINNNNINNIYNKKIVSDNNTPLLIQKKGKDEKSYKNNR